MHQHYFYNQTPNLENKNGGGSRTPDINGYQNNSPHNQTQKIGRSMSDYLNLDST